MPDEANLTMKPNSLLELDPGDASSVLLLVENLEESDDVNAVYHNLEITDEMMAEFA
jgi:transcriptional/translational regulatory protein YebC/TACO1